MRGGVGQPPAGAADAAGPEDAGGTDASGRRGHGSRYASPGIPRKILTGSGLYQIYEEGANVASRLGFKRTVQDFLGPPRTSWNLLGPKFPSRIYIKA